MRRPNPVALALAATAATVAMISGAVTAIADAPAAPAACETPAIEDLGDDVQATVVCTYPKVTETATVTATVTETVTETVPGPTTTVTATATPTPTPTPSPVAPKVIIGMSASSGLWDQRLSEVGPCGVEARRIFADLTSSGMDQSNLIAQAIQQTMLPVISYKVPNVATLNSNGYDSWLNNLNAYLDGLDVPVTVTFNHEPYPELTGAEFKAGSQQFLDHITAPNINVGPIMNGWLMDNRMADFASYSTPALISQWDFFGVDSYQGGTESNPDPVKYGGRAVPLLRAWLDGQGFTDEQIVVGEYNGYTATSIDQGGEQILKGENKVLAGLVFNSDVGAKGFPLSGQRLTEYQQTKADSQALHDPPC